MIGRFVSADSIVPGAANPQAWNRYAYTLNNPVRYTDPTGHCVLGIVVDTPICAAVIDALLFGGTALVSIGFIKVTGDAIQDAARDAPSAPPPASFGPIGARAAMAGTAAAIVQAAAPTAHWFAPTYTSTPTTTPVYTPTMTPTTGATTTGTPTPTSVPIQEPDPRIE